MAIKAAQTLGLDVAGVDLLRAHRGPLVMEVNASPGLEGIETTTHVDIAGRMIAWIERRATPGYCLKNGRVASLRYPFMECDAFFCVSYASFFYPARGHRHYGFTGRSGS